MTLLRLGHILVSTIIPYWLIWIGCVVIGSLSHWYWLMNPVVALIGAVVIALAADHVANDRRPRLL